MRSLVDNLDKVILDIWALIIDEVKDEAQNKLQFEIKDPNPFIGLALEIKLLKPINKDEEFKIWISYKTTEEGLSLNWLDPPQTAGKKHPYVYTHCEAIDCWCLAPLQDSPYIKSTYSAKIKSPKDLKVEMSGNKTKENVIGEYRFSEFLSGLPIPSYLLALVAGNIEYRSLGARTGVFAEPE